MDHILAFTMTKERNDAIVISLNSRCAFLCNRYFFPS